MQVLSRTSAGNTRPGKIIKALTFTRSRTPSLKMLDPQFERATATDGSASEDVGQKCSRTRHFAYSAVSWRNEDSMSHNFDAATMESAQTKR